MLSSAYEENFFSEEDCKTVINDLLNNSDDISNEDKTEIQKYIKEKYAELYNEYKKSQCEWVKPLHNWLDNYRSE